MPDETAFTRIQFDLPKSRVEELDDIARAAGITTRKDLFNNALTLLEWALKQRSEGKKIIVTGGPGPDKELSMPILDAAAKVTR